MICGTPGAKGYQEWQEMASMNVIKEEILKRGETFLRQLKLKHCPNRVEFAREFVPHRSVKGVCDQALYEREMPRR
jgi:hypothetical protein